MLCANASDAFPLYTISGPMADSRPSRNISFSVASSSSRNGVRLVARRSGVRQLGKRSAQAG